MKEKLMNIFKKKFVKNVMVIATGTAMAQAITFLLLPLVTRLYGPDAYGLMSSFIAIVAILTPIAALTLPLAIVLPKEEREAISIIRVSLMINLLLFIIFLFTIHFLYESIIEILNAEKIGQYIYLLPFVIFLAGLFQIMRQWLIRNKQFKVISQVAILQPIFTYGGMVSMGVVYPIAPILIIFSSLRDAFATLLMYKKVKNKSSIRIKLEKFSLTLGETLKKYKDFPQFRAPEAFISSISQNLPVLLLSTFMGPAGAGYYTLALTALSLPAKFLGTAVGDVFYPRVAEGFNKNENLNSLLLKATLALLAVGALPFGLIIVTGPWIFTLIFGEEWVVAGEYSKWIAIMSFFMFISRPTIKVLPVIGAQKFHLIFTIIMTFTRISSLYVGLVYLNHMVAIATFSIASSCLYLILIIATFKKIRTLIR
ncbi:lipopolysaccharide biosynthesis protein [Halobacillus sp. Marseille-P3879]|uniref:lipopolysaccharide biosynthesis protein n=1 Tax=Halobacillus sp. Marseille-P3879 TaxID=2045014 RepID=UPI000C79D71C|nr:oligosaccharide flippase family protein [Halobacillus sp. Marseille-P3879]